MKACRSVLFFLLPLYFSEIAFGNYYLQLEKGIQEFFTQKIEEARRYYPIVLENMEKEIEYCKSNKLDLKEDIIQQCMGVGFILHNDRDLVDCWNMGYYLIYLQDHKILLSEKDCSIIKRVLGIMKCMISYEGNPEDKDALDKLSVDKIFVEVKETEKSFLRQIFPFWKS
jgi:hypothetical protein